MTVISILGTGSALKDFLSILPSDVTICGLGDNNSAKQGAKIEGYTVYSPDVLVGMGCDLYVIAGRAVDQIRDQLLGLGVANEKIVAYYPSYSQNLRALGRRLISAQPKPD